MNLNVFETMPILGCDTFRISGASLMINGVYVPGSIPFLTPWIRLGNTNGGIGTHTISLGLYTLNGSTLTLVNSASGTQVLNGNAVSWVSLVTSVASTITPGQYYFGILVSIGTANSPQILAADGGVTATNTMILGGYGGAFVRGCLSVSTSGMPASIATTDCIKEGSSSVRPSTVIPYVLISA